MAHSNNTATRVDPQKPGFFEKPGFFAVANFLERAIRPNDDPILSHAEKGILCVDAT